MNSVKFHALVKVLVNRMRDCQLINDDNFYKCLNGNFENLEREELEELVITLFDEHTRLTSLINDVSDLVTTSEKFSLLFE